MAMQLFPTAVTTLRGDPCLPLRACLFSSGLTGSAYRACGEAASALHAMMLLQVQGSRFKVSFICHILNYTEYNQ